MSAEDDGIGLKLKRMGRVAGLDSGMMVSGGYHQRDDRKWRNTLDAFDFSDGNSCFKGFPKMKNIHCKAASIKKITTRSFVAGFGGGSPKGVTLAKYRLGEKEIVETYQLRGHSDRIVGLDFSAPRNILISGSDDATVRVWKLDKEYGEMNGNNGEEKSQSDVSVRDSLHCFYDSSMDVWSVKFLTPGSNLIASANYGGEILIHNLEKMKLQHFLAKYHRGYIGGIEFDKIKNVLFSCSIDGTVKVLDFRRNEVVNTIKVGTGLLSILSLPESNEILVGEGRKEFEKYSREKYSIFSFDVRQNSRPMKKIDAHETRIWRIISLPDKNCVCSSGRNVKILRRDDYDQIFNLEGSSRGGGRVLGLEYFYDSPSRSKIQSIKDMETRTKFICTGNESAMFSYVRIKYLFPTPRIGMSIEKQREWKVLRLLLSFG